MSTNQPDTMSINLDEPSWEDMLRDVQEALGEPPTPRRWQPERPSPQEEWQRLLKLISHLSTMAAR